MSYTPPLGHFNLAGIGHYYFALTPRKINLTTVKNTFILMPMNIKLFAAQVYAYYYGVSNQDAVGSV